ncbi:ABC-2 family transporter protein [Patescibacteria group bacterium]|nr:ABC-2 family transporter protein [Patescibacteria group bacterium]
MKQWVIEAKNDWLHSFMVYLVWARMIWLRQLAYRFNSFFSSLGSIFWLAGSLLTLNLIFGKVHSLAGWDWQSMLVLYGVYNLWWGIMVAFFNGGLAISSRVRMGSLDKIMLWPGKVFFYASMKFEPELLTHFLFGLIVLIAALIRSGLSISISNLGPFIILMINSWLLIFFISVIFGATAFWFIENSHLTNLFWVWESLAKYPRQFFIHYKLLYLAVYTILPVVFIAVVPAEVLLSRSNWFLVAGSFLVTLIAAFLAKTIWRLGLKRYSGVSI